MATWEDVLKNREQYPDTMEVPNLGVTVGQLRDGFVPKADLTNATTQQAQKHKQQLEQFQNAAQAREQMFQQQLAQAMQRQGVNPNNAAEDDLSPYRSDPTFGPLVKALDATRQQNQQLMQRVQMDEVSVRTMRYQDELNQLKKEHPDLNERELADYTAKLWQGGPDLKVAKRLYTYDQDIKRIETEAEKRGYEKAKAEPPVVAMPGHGRRSRSSANEPKPKDMKQAAEMALNDPEIMSTFQEA